MPLLTSSLPQSKQPSSITNSITNSSRYRSLYRRSLVSLLAVAAGTLLAAGCGNAVDNSNASGGITGPAFIVGTDAPLPSVTSFAVQLQSIDAITASGTSVSLLSGSPTVDFARFNGLQTLLDMNDVPAGTYTSVSISLGPATLGYLNVVSGSAPTIASQSATLTTSNINIPLATPLVVTQSGPVGLHLDFDLRKSIQVNGTGQITGVVTPTFDVKAVGTGDSGAYVDEFDAAVVSVNATAQSFVVQGPHGRNFTVNVNGSTEWDNNESLSSLSTSSIVQLSGALDKADATIDADEVAILSQNGFYAHGQVTYVTPSSGPATSFDLYVRGLLPTTTGLTLGQIAQVNLSGSEKFFIYWMHNPLTQFLFNSSALLPGQSVSIGGPASGATNPLAVTANRVVLRHWGYNGTVVPGSLNPANGTFQMQVNGFAGLLIPETVTVYTSSASSFRDGLTTMSSVTASANVRVVGLLLKNTANGQAILLARYVDALN
jgi:Domain of unknown function (DUF4382)/Domain of unknown function (DUF5666)